MERKLAAIFSTDVVGYSRLMGDDEEATVRTLKMYRVVITDLIEHHHGRVLVQMTNGKQTRASLGCFSRC